MIAIYRENYRRRIGKGIHTSQAFELRTMFCTLINNVCIGCYKEDMNRMERKESEGEGQNVLFEMEERSIMVRRSLCTEIEQVR